MSSSSSVSKLSVGEFIVPLHNDLTSSQRALRERVHVFAHQEILPLVAEYEEKAEFPTQIILPLLRKLNIIGLDSITAQPQLVEEMKQTNHGVFPFANYTAFENGLIALELARVSMGLATFVQILQPITMLSIAKCGSEEQKRKYLPKLANLELVGCYGLTEPYAGSDASHLKTMATPTERDGVQGWLLTGQKRWIGNGSWADIYIIWATHSVTGKTQGFIVEKGTKGLSAKKMEYKIALRMVQNADIYLDDVFVPESQRLPLCTDFASGPARSLFLTRIMACFIATGGAMGCWDHVWDYVNKRYQFEAPLSAFQINQIYLMQMLSKLQSMMLMSKQIATLYDIGKVTYGQIGLSKYYVTSTGRELVSLGRNLCGGNGLLFDYGVGRYFVDMEAAHTYEGAAEINALIAAREITGIAAFRAAQTAAASTKKQKKEGEKEKDIFVNLKPNIKSRL